MYISATSNGLMIVDVSNPETPETISTVSGIDGIDVYVDQDYAYVASGTSYSIIDVSNPSKPRDIGNSTWKREKLQIHAVQETLYLGEVNQGLMIYDITDPTHQYICPNSARHHGYLRHSI